MLLPFCLQAQNDSDSTTDKEVATSNTRTMLGTYYADKFVGRKTSNGEIFRQNQYTAAHRTIPFGTYLLVKNPATGAQVVVRVNDRCPKSNILDMTKLAVHALGIRGSAKVQVSEIDPKMGHYIWSNQDTLAMTEKEYMAYGDRSPQRRISPYPIGPTTMVTQKIGNTTPTTLASRAADETPSKPPRPKPPMSKQKPAAAAPKDTAVVLDTVAEPTSDTAAVIETEPIPQGPLYDIELCIVNSKNAAIREVLRMPKEYQEKVILDRNEINGQITIILGLADTRSHAVRTQAMLIDTYPDSYVVPHKDRAKSPQK